MGVITYYAVDRGELVSGHADGTLYQIEIPFAAWNRSNKRISKTQKSLSGTRHTILTRLEKFYDFETVATDNAGLIASLDEFFSSVAGGETFELDPFGTATVPDNPISCVLEGDWKVSRSNQTELSYSAKVEAV